MLRTKTIHPIRENVTLAPYTTWKVGGPATFFWEPTADELPAMLSHCYREGIATFYLGRGSNVLIADEGLEGLVICSRSSLKKIWREDDCIIAEAGVPLPTLSKFVAALGYGGYEFLIGIPGTVGAGVAINAGLTAREVSDISSVLVKVDILTAAGEFHRVDASQLQLSYRNSLLITQNAYVVRAKFQLRQPVSPQEIRQKTALHLADRRRKQPLTRPTAGSTFKQPHNGKPAGWYIDQAGLKGFRIGGAMVSYKHANWIENDGTATAADIRAVIEHIQGVVEAKFEVRLEREVRYLPGAITSKRVK